MERMEGKYALIQFCPLPERQEYLNVGLVLVVPQIGFVGVRIARGQRRVERVFGKQSKLYLDAIKRSFESRLLLELSQDPVGGGLNEFARKRANEMRLSPLLPVAIDDLDADFDKLFRELVGDDEPLAREPRARKKLRDAFVSNKVEQFLDRPDEVQLPEYGFSVNVPYGYQNGCYNFVDAMRISQEPSDALREAGKRSMEGDFIWKHFEQSEHCKRLVVVADFSNQSNAFYNAVSDRFKEANVKLYRFDDLNPLFRDIVDNAELHGKVHQS
jgi:hypothetical protein